MGKFDNVPVPLAVTTTPLYTRLPPGNGSTPVQLLLAADGEGVIDGVKEGDILGDTVGEGVSDTVGVGDGEGDIAIMFGWNETLLQLGTCEAPDVKAPVSFI